MAIQSGQITAGSTAMSLSITGGSAVTLTSIGGTGKSQELVIATDTDSRVRRRVKVSAVDSKPVASMPSGFTMNKGSIEFISPKVLANGKTEYPKISVIKNISVENTASEITELRRILAQLALDPDFDDFWNLNSVR